MPRRGWRVRPLDEGDLDEYLAVREVLELMAMELAAPHLVEGDLKRMLAGNVVGGHGKEPSLDNDLHRYMIEKAGNSYIRDFFERYGAYYTTVFDFAAPETHIVSGMARQHRAILKALIDRDWPKAREAAREAHPRAGADRQGADAAAQRFAGGERPGQREGHVMTSGRQTVRVIDSHTGGEPTRVVIDGGPTLAAGHSPGGCEPSARATTRSARPSSTSRAART